MERVEDLEMPPADSEGPEEEQRRGFVDQLKAALIVADQHQHEQYGRGVVRRLNRSEFETALEDLLHLPLNIQKELPEDAKSHGFDTVGAALNVSSVQMQAYLDVIDGVLDQATALHEAPRPAKHRLTFRESTGLMQVYRRGGPYSVQDDGVAIFATEKFSHLNAVLDQYTVPHQGRYRVTVSAYAVRPKEPVILSLRAGGNGHAESNHVPHVFLDHFQLSEGAPQTYRWEGWLQRGHFFHVYPTSLRPMRFAGKQEFLTQHAYQGPGAVVQWVDVEGPLFDSWPPRSHRALWGDVPTQPIDGAMPNENPIAQLDGPPQKIAKPRLTEVEPDKTSGNKMVYDPDQGIGGEPIYGQVGIPKPLHWTRRLVPDNPRDEATELLTRFASRAFRRPVQPADIAPIIDLTDRWLGEGRDFEAAMRIGYKAILTSPDFLYHQSTLPAAGNRLSPHGIAERLAFFLWNGLPDAALLRLATEGQLRDPAVMRQQVDRMLADERSDRFLKEFLGSWLDLDLIDFTVPDEKLYPEHDPLLQWSLTRETTAFFKKLIEEDLSATHIIDSDFAMVNERLAKHYDLPPVDGMHLRSVSLPADSVRGGVITQASVLKVTANGTTTSPVVRGVWMLERILGVHPSPPPPGIPAIEPDIRGAVTIRDQLEKHRSDAACASCHAKIDPPGMALECFDVIGGHRTRYRAINEELADRQFKFSPRCTAPHSVPRRSTGGRFVCDARRRVL